MEEQIVQVLDELVTTVKELSPQLWEILLHQAKLDGYAKLISAVLTTILFIFLASLVNFMLRKRSRLQELDRLDEDVSMGLVFGSIVVGGVSILVIGIAMDLMINGMKMIVNPEYYAIKLLLEQLK